MGSCKCYLPPGRGEKQLKQVLDVCVVYLLCMWDVRESSCIGSKTFRWESSGGEDRKSLTDIILCSGSLFWVPFSEGQKLVPFLPKDFYSEQTQKENLKEPANRIHFESGCENTGGGSDACQSAWSEV